MEIVVGIVDAAVGGIREGATVGAVGKLSNLINDMILLRCVFMN